MTEWQEIETAPRDGTEIIGIFSNDYGYQDRPTVYGPWTIAFKDGQWQSSWDRSRIIQSQSDCGTEYKETEIDPTHWHPIPPFIQSKPTALIEPTENEKLRSALQAALDTIFDYLNYSNDEDPYAEDSRTMGEMDINDYARDGRMEYAMSLLIQSKNKGSE